MTFISALRGSNSLGSLEPSCGHIHHLIQEVQNLFMALILVLVKVRFLSNPIKILGEIII